jgi:hypothetical protein
VAQPAAASVTKTHRDPKPQEVAEAQQAATNFVLGQKLVKQFYFVHDNGGSKVEQCVGGHVTASTDEATPLKPSTKGRPGPGSGGFEQHQRDDAG